MSPIPAEKARHQVRAVLLPQCSSSILATRNPIGDKGDGGDTSSNFLSPMKEHEKRAINFLVNEYLLLSNCKLTAITLADENDGNQDLDDWDDVSLNVPRPQPLVAIYREHMHGGCGGGSDVAASGNRCAVTRAHAQQMRGSQIRGH